MVKHTLTEVKAVFDPAKRKIIGYLKDKPNGSTKYDMVKDLKMEEDKIGFDLLELSSAGILKKDITTVTDPPGKKPGVYALNLYTLDSDKLESTKLGLIDYLRRL